MTDSNYITLRTVRTGPNTRNLRFFVLVHSPQILCISSFCFRVRIHPSVCIRNRMNLAQNWRNRAKLLRNCDCRKVERTHHLHSQLLLFCSRPQFRQSKIFCSVSIPVSIFRMICWILHIWKLPVKNFLVHIKWVAREVLYQSTSKIILVAGRVYTLLCCEVGLMKNSCRSDYLSIPRTKT